jgi:Short C-terminal domain
MGLMMRRRRPMMRVAETSTDQLANLAQLHTSGALTDEEFAAAKAKLLGI